MLGQEPQKLERQAARRKTLCVDARLGYKHEISEE